MLSHRSFSHFTKPFSFRVPVTLSLLHSLEVTALTIAVPNSLMSDFLQVGYLLLLFLPILWLGNAMLPDLFTSKLLLTPYMGTQSLLQRIIFLTSLTLGLKQREREQILMVSDPEYSNFILRNWGTNQNGLWLLLGNH